jgi:hypothetical protein
MGITGTIVSPNERRGGGRTTVAPFYGGIPAHSFFFSKPLKAKERFRSLQMRKITLAGPSGWFVNQRLNSREKLRGHYQSY